MAARGSPMMTYFSRIQLFVGEVCTKEVTGARSATRVCPQEKLRVKYRVDEGKDSKTNHYCATTKAKAFQAMWYRGEPATHCSGDHAPHSIRQEGDGAEDSSKEQELGDQVTFRAIYKLGEDCGKEDQGLGVENSNHEAFEDGLPDRGLSTSHIGH